MRGFSWLIFEPARPARTLLIFRAALRGGAQCAGGWGMPVPPRSPRPSAGIGVRGGLGAGIVGCRYRFAVGGWLGGVRLGLGGGWGCWARLEGGWLAVAGRPGRAAAVAGRPSGRLLLPARAEQAAGQVPHPMHAPGVV
ncbi:hypothetical protein GCM10017788_31100 [Amycolatopsis acidiphila]|nr:hypothetical protein GCM10017788_31100 [Amycolatopsis acidiphila]